jgi:hypothetical protein
MVSIFARKAKKLILFVFYILLIIIILLVCKFNYSIKAYPKSAGIPGLISKSNIDYLFIGSSLTRHAYDIKLIENKYHVNAFAVAYNGMSPLMAYKILKYTLENTNTRLKTVIIEAYPYKLFAPPNSIEDVRLFNSSPPRLKMDILNEMYHYDHDLARIYNLVVLADNENILAAPITYKLIEKLSYNGGYANNHKSVPGISKFKGNKELYIAQNINKHIYNQQLIAYINIIELCKVNNIRIIFVEPFLPNYIQNGTNYNSAKNLVKNLVTESGSLLYENSLTTLNNGDPSIFADDIHLSSKGRELWSLEIMRIIGGSK